MPPKRTTAQSTKQVNYTTATAAATTSTLISKRMDNERDNDDGSRRRLHQQQQQQTNNERKTVTLKKRKVDRHHVCDDEGNEDGEMIDVDGVGIGVGMNEVDENEMMMVMTNKKNNDDGGVNAGDGNNNNSNSHSGEVMAATKPVELHDDGDNDADVNVVKELGKNEEEGHYLNNDDGYHDDVAYGRVIVVDNVVDENGDDEDEDMEEMDRAYRLHQVLSEMTKNVCMPSSSPPGLHKKSFFSICVTSCTNENNLFLSLAEIQKG